MLDSTITTSYSDDGVVAATNKLWTKRAHEVNAAIYRRDTVIADPGLPDHRITITTSEAKPTSSFYGVRRVTLNVRRMAEVAVPGGTAYYPVIFKVETSIPIGVSAANIEGDIGAFRSIVSHDIFKRLAKTLET